MSLAIRFKKNTDGTVALTCTRADGSTTWQRQDASRARHFIFHDLTHFAVETVLGVRRAFYGLVAEGWNLTDFGSDRAPGALPAEAIQTEVLVGLLDMERADGTQRSAAELNEQAAVSLREDIQPPHVSEAQLVSIRAQRDSLVSRWVAVPAGEALELEFEPGLEPVA